MTRTDVIVGGVLAVAFGAFALQATALTYADEFAPGAGFAPLWLGVLGTLLSLWIVASALRGRPVPRPDLGALARLLVAIFTLVVAVALADAIGFVAATALALIVLTLVVERMHPVSALATTAVTVGIVYVVFARLLNVPFPEGPLGF